MAKNLKYVRIDMFKLVLKTVTKSKINILNSGTGIVSPGADPDPDK
jgi:hypothetical protein